MNVSESGAGRVWRHASVFRDGCVRGSIRDGRKLGSESMDEGVRSRGCGEMARGVAEILGTGLGGVLGRSECGGVGLL